MKLLISALTLLFLTSCATAPKVVEGVLGVGEGVFKDVVSVVRGVEYVVKVPVKDAVKAVDENLLVLTPEPYKGWGWSPKEYKALKDCEAKGGKMGSSKVCRLPK